MTKVCANYPGPFTPPRLPTANLAGNIRSTDLKIAARRLTACQNPSELQDRIIEIAHDNFADFGKSVVFAGFWIGNKFIAYTIPKSIDPIPRNAGRYISIGGNPSFPMEPELIQEALSTKDIVPGGSSDEKFLAMALVSNDRSAVLGVLLLSNRLSNGSAGFTDDDIEIFKQLGEIASEAVSRLLPPQSSFRSLS